MNQESERILFEFTIKQLSKNGFTKYIPDLFITDPKGILYKCQTPHEGRTFLGLASDIDYLDKLNLIIEKIDLEKLVDHIKKEKIAIPEELKKEIRYSFCAYRSYDEAPESLKNLAELSRKLMKNVYSRSNFRSFMAYLAGDDNVNEREVRSKYLESCINGCILGTNFSLLLEKNIPEYKSNRPFSHLTDIVPINELEFRKEQAEAACHLLDSNSKLISKDFKYK